MVNSGFPFMVYCHTLNLLCSSLLDWGRHVAEILLGRSLKWNVHRISLQCLRGSVLPYRLWVSEHSPCALWPSGMFKVALKGKTPHLCPTQSGYSTTTKDILCAPSYVVSRKVGQYVVPALGISLALLFPVALRTLWLDPSFALNYALQFSCMSWIWLLPRRTQLWRVLGTHVSDFTRMKTNLASHLMKWILIFSSQIR